ncbi:MAG: zonular occludens toxin domain-containing protein [Sedimenticola sp.]
MSTIAYTGLPGSGKSYGVVENVIIPALEEGRTIITNIPLNEIEIYRHLHEKGIKKLDIRNLDIQQAQDTPEYLSSFPGGSVIVIDECWRLWPAGLKTNQVPEKHKSFLAEHRHRVGQDGRSQEIILVTQDLAQIAAFARQLIEETYRSVKLTAIGQKDKYRIDVYSGAVMGNNPRGQRLRQIFGKYKKTVFRFYSSHTMSETGKAGNEDKVDKRANALKSSIIRFGIPVGALALIAGVYIAVTSLIGIFQTEPEEIPRQPEVTDRYAPKLDIQQHQLPQEQTIPGLQLHEPAEAPYSTVWRLGGFIDGYRDGQKREMAVLIGRGRIRYIPADNCRQIEDTPERECQVDGETVTFWSGQEMNSMAVSKVERQI